MCGWSLQAAQQPSWRKLVRRRKGQRLGHHGDERKAWRGAQGHALLRNTDLGGGFQNVARRRAETRGELLTADPSTTENGSGTQLLPCSLQVKLVLDPGKKHETRLGIQDNFLYCYQKAFISTMAPIQYLPQGCGERAYNWDGSF